jgi:hypothetical protein
MVPGGMLQESGGCATIIAMVPVQAFPVSESASLEPESGGSSRVHRRSWWPSVAGREWRWAWVASLLIVGLVSLPYLVSWLLTPAGFQFTGLLVNPVDGHSYLAKIGQGAAGSWLFRLPYTPEPHEPVFVYSYYLALGHLAPANSPLTWVWLYHLARSVFGVALLLAFYGTASLFMQDVAQRRLAFLFAGLASGLGWLVGSGPDLTVPEAVTFASLLVNGHFGATLLLILLAVGGITVAPADRRWWALLPIASVWLAMIQPYALLVVGLATGGWVAIRWVQERRLPRLPSGRLVLVGLAASPVLAYYLWMLRANPHIGRWMAQNITPSPPLWQWLTAYGILVPLAAAGAWRCAKRRTPEDWLLLVWVGAQLALMLLPISMQRRLSTGLHLPLCLLAAIGWREVIAHRLVARRRRLLEAGLLLIAFPSNLLLLLAGPHAVLTGDPYVLLTDDQWQAMAWLRERVPAEAVVLTDDELGTIVPAWGGGARVVYGHPFETLDAEEKRAAVNRFCSGRMSADEGADLIGRYHVGGIILQAGRCDPSSLPPGFRLAWESDTVSIYLAEDL